MFLCGAVLRGCLVLLVSGCVCMFLWVDEGACKAVSWRAPCIRRTRRVTILGNLLCSVCVRVCMYPCVSGKCCGLLCVQVWFCQLLLLCVCFCNARPRPLASKRVDPISNKLIKIKENKPPLYPLQVGLARLWNRRRLFGSNLKSSILAPKS